MPENFIFTILGFFLAFILFIILWWLFFRPRGSGKEVRIYSSIEQLRSVGELVAFKMVTKEIVTASQHWFGDTGKRYFQWLVSTKKMAMIFEFDIDFRYDLRSTDFKIEQLNENRYTLKMPPCLYQVHIRDISFYDEQNSKFLPWLLPDLLNRAFGSGFSEADKNLLKEEAKNQAAKLAEGVVNKLQSEVENSARQTLLTLVKSLGVEKVAIDFSQSKIVPSTVQTNELEANMQKAKNKIKSLVSKKEE
ncbi:MAG: DUF4230 domain-containing protein [Atribacterota bacterium]|jgi:hypothetical protein|nr:DUF4230 domain-containing protein [Atribacterota bacterium]MDD4895355.1 DUF4230 domain-containing protein [Atribacterota bacterium]MDD5637105.1 DUF4230 domain-containing protein [Atribacterota bacterium]